MRSLCGKVRNHAGMAALPFPSTTMTWCDSRHSIPRTGAERFAPFNDKAPVKGGGGPPRRSEVYRYFAYPLLYQNQTEQFESVVAVRMAGASGGKPCGRIPEVGVGGFGIQECDYRSRAGSQRPLLHGGLTHPVHGYHNIRPTFRSPLRQEWNEFRGPVPAGTRQDLSCRG